ncbi:hypothetical protein [Candidatus Finniella inopinata]|uniref:Uncharacterized protein n=1 Tax=Candidatus Finniella inopinata TaxID=1696036 RepID=A0A4Q7DGL0_9PROT|nr:hypothetical protein [Candidatus Finniella inopinata]RZI45338.1 hypothetical protein EQU50_07345 [Candidatus Finniella inopinata]
MKSITYLFLFVITFIWSADLKAIQEEASPESYVAWTIKQNLDSLNDQAAYNLVKDHFIQLKLLNFDGKWAAPQLEAIGDELLPRGISTADFNNMVDLMATNAEKNPYLHQFMLEANKADLTEFYDKVKRDGPKVFPELIAYAMTLNALTKSMRDDVTVLKATMQVWGKASASINIFNTGGFMYWVKYQSVKSPLKKAIQAIETGKVDPDYCRNYLPLNILEATLIDWLMGNNGNAKAGWVLANSRPGGPENKVIGSGPASLSPDGQAVLLHMPFPKEWADLYSVWNLGFVSHLEDFPYWMVKLLIPQVSGYQSVPEEYMHNRVLALYSQLQFELFRRSEGDTVIADWKHENLTKCFNDSNAKSAKQYKDLLTSARTI